MPEKYTTGDAFEADVRDNSVGAESQDPGNFPFEAFEFDDPGKNANPEIRVKDPWILSSGNVTPPDEYEPADELPLGAIGFWHKSLEARTGTAKSTGSADTDTADKLVDSGADFTGSGDDISIGDIVYNSTDGTYATVQAVDSATTLSLDWDAFPDGTDSYEIYPEPDVQPGWIEFGDGSGSDITINDPDSPFDGMTIPDIIGEERFIRARETAGRLQLDQMQGHWHQQYASTDQGDGSTGSTFLLFNRNGTFTTSTNDSDGNQAVQEAVSDGTNGTPRTGDETRPTNLSAVPILKIKMSGDVKLATYYSVSGDNFADLTDGTELDPEDKLVYWDASTSSYKALPVGLLSLAGWPSILAEHVEPSGTDAGHTTVDTWTTRELNTLRQNEVSGASFDVNNYQMTLPAGKYYTTFFSSTMRVQNIGLRLRNISTGQTLLVSNVTYSKGGTGDSTHMRGEGFFELTGESVIELQYFADYDEGDNYNLGITVNNSSYVEDVVHAQLHVWQRYANSRTVSTEVVNNINFPPGLLVSQWTSSNETSSCGGSVWCKSPINTTDHNAIQNASVDLSNSQFTLPAGTYFGTVRHFFMRSKHVAARLHDVTHNIELVRTSNLYADPDSDGDGIITVGEGYFTLTETATIEIQHWYTSSSSYEIAYGGFNGGPTPVRSAHILQINEFQITEDVTYSYDANHPPTMILEDQKPSGTDGGTNSTSRATRDLNTVVQNDISGASLDAATGVFTLPAGMYEVEWWSPFYDVNLFVTWLYDLTNGVDIAQSQSQRNDNGVSTDAIGFTPRISISSTTEYRIDYNTQTSNAGHGLGIEVNSQIPVDHELYTRVRVRKVG
jgi:hypothetical protein